MYFTHDAEHQFYYMGEDEPNSHTFQDRLFNSNPRIVAVDVETISLKERIAIGLSISTSPTCSFYFPLFPTESSFVPWHLLKDPAIENIYHNGIFDLGCLSEYNVNQLIQDTNIMSRLLCHKDNGLLDLGWLHGMEVHNVRDMLRDAGAKIMLDLAEEVVARKCCQDGMATFKLYQIFQPQTNMEYYNVERATLPIMLKMSERGILIDHKVRQAIESQLEDDVELYFNMCKEAEDFNPGSPQQVSYVLAKRGAYSVFGRLPYTKNKYGKPTSSLSTAEEVLEVMEDPLAQLVLEYRRRAKLLSTYIVPWANDDRAYTRYHLDAITGRPSSTDRNMQNIPGIKSRMGINTRGFLIPDSGTWTDVDFSQLELRILAFLSQDREMLHIYETEGDIHQITADFLNIDRKICKNINFCVPTTTEALTLDGWRPHHMLKEGEFVLGYSPEMESYIWTRIISVMEPVKDTIVDFGNKHTSLESTLSHRWYGERYIDYANTWKPEVHMLNQVLNTDSRYNYRIRLSSRLWDMCQIYNAENISAITPKDASIIAWLYTDGTINKDKHQSWIFQTKQKQQESIRNLLKGVPHTEDRARQDGLIVWRLSFPWVRSLLINAKLWDTITLEKFVLNLPTASRIAFLSVCVAAEGHHSDCNQLTISQNKGDTLAAIQLAASLEGYFTKILDHSTTTYPDGRVVRLLKPYITCQKMEIHDTRTDFVWCMQTGLGNWVARDSHRQIFITGNAMIYGGNDQTLAETAHIKSRERAKSLRNMWFQLFPQAGDYIQTMNEEIARGKSRVKTLFGREMRLPDINEESLQKRQNKGMNYPIQGTGADILKRSLIALQDLDIALQVHDELVIDGLILPDKFEVMESIAPFRTPVEVRYLERWE